MYVPIRERERERERERVSFCIDGWGRQRKIAFLSITLSI